MQVERVSIHTTDEAARGLRNVDDHAARRSSRATVSDCPPRSDSKHLRLGGI
jgi:hypothetical protein